MAVDAKKVINSCQGITDMEMNGSTTNTKRVYHCGADSDDDATNRWLWASTEDLVEPLIPKKAITSYRVMFSMNVMRGPGGGKQASGKYWAMPRVPTTWLYLATASADRGALKFSVENFPAHCAGWGDGVGTR